MGEHRERQRGTERDDDVEQRERDDYEHRERDDDVEEQRERQPGTERETMRIMLLSPHVVCV